LNILKPAYSAAIYFAIFRHSLDHPALEYALYPVLCCPPQSPYGLHPKPVFGKDYLWYESRVRVRVRDLRLELGFFLRFG
jgi:hypothetical protein